MFDYIFKLAVILLPVLVFGQWIVAVINLSKNSDLFKQIAQLSKCLTSYQNICELIEKTTFTSTHMNNLKSSLSESSSKHKSFVNVANVIEDLVCISTCKLIRLSNSAILSNQLFIFFPYLSIHISKRSRQLTSHNKIPFENIYFNAFGG